MSAFFNMHQRFDWKNEYGRWNCTRTFGGHSNFRRSYLGCIGAEFRNQTLICQNFFETYKMYIHVAPLRPQNIVW
jgi:hypothetical protein